LRRKSWSKKRARGERPDNSHNDNDKAEDRRHNFFQNTRWTLFFLRRNLQKKQPLPRKKSHPRTFAASKATLKVGEKLHNKNDEKQDVIYFQQNNLCNNAFFNLLKSNYLGLSRATAEE
jgi:hypothetical protein